MTRNVREKQGDKTYYVLREGELRQSGRASSSCVAVTAYLVGSELKVLMKSRPETPLVFFGINAEKVQQILWSGQGSFTEEEESRWADEQLQSLSILSLEVELVGQPYQGRFRALAEAIWTAAISEEDRKMGLPESVVFRVARGQVVSGDDLIGNVDFFSIRGR